MNDIDLFNYKDSYDHAYDYLLNDHVEELCRFLKFLGINSHAELQDFIAEAAKQFDKDPDAFLQKQNNMPKWLSYTCWKKTCTALTYLESPLEESPNPEYGTLLMIPMPGQKKWVPEKATNYELALADLMEAIRIKALISAGILDESRKTSSPQKKGGIASSKRWVPAKMVVRKVAYSLWVTSRPPGSIIRKKEVAHLALSEIYNKDLEHIPGLAAVENWLKDLDFYPDEAKKGGRPKEKK